MGMQTHDKLTAPSDAPYAKTPWSRSISVHGSMGPPRRVQEKAWGSQNFKGRTFLAKRLTMENYCPKRIFLRSRRARGPVAPASPRDGLVVI